MRTSRDDRGAVRLVSLSWLLGFLAVAGIGGYDAVSVISARLSAADDAQNAAYAASQAWHNAPNYGAAYQAAQAILAGGPDKLVGAISFDGDGTAHLVVRRPVSVVLFDHIGSLRHYRVAVEHGDANAIA